MICNQGLLHLWFFHHTFNSIKISCCSHPNFHELIAMKFCTWHNSSAVMAYGKVCSSVIISNGVTMKLNFHQIWIIMEKLLVRWLAGSPFNYDPSISNYIHYKRWYDITYSFPDFNGATIEIWKWISTVSVITYPYRELIHVSIMGPRSQNYNHYLGGTTVKQDKLNERHVCWCPGPVHHHIISSNVIYLLHDIARSLLSTRKDFDPNFSVKCWCMCKFLQNSNLQPWNESSFNMKLHKAVPMKLHMDFTLQFCDIRNVYLLQNWSWFSLQQVLPSKCITQNFIWISLQVHPTIIAELALQYIDGLAADCGNSIANTLELQQSCI